MQKHSAAVATAVMVVLWLLWPLSATSVLAATNTPRPIKECRVCLEEGAPLFTPTPTPPTPTTRLVTVYFFWGDGCPHCAAEKPFLERLTQQSPNVEVRAFEVWNSPENRDLFYKVAASLGFEPRAVPTTIIGERYWVGYNDQIGREIEAAVTACAARAAGCRDAGQGIVPYASS